MAISSSGCRERVVGRAARLVPRSGRRRAVHQQASASTARRLRPMTATEEAQAFAHTAARSCRGQARHRHRAHRRQRATGHHRRVRRRHRKQRASGRGDRRRGRGEAAAPGRQADPPRGAARRPVGAARLRRHRGARPARRGARVLRAGAAVEGLPVHPVRRAATPPDRAPPGDAVRREWPQARAAASRTHRWNAEHRFQGQADPPLDDVGRAQAYEVAAIIAAMRPSLLVSSDAAPGRGRPPQIVGEAVGAARCSRAAAAGARRSATGKGLTLDEVAARYPDEYAEWAAGRDVSRRGGETREQVAERAHAGIRRAARGADLTVLVTHGATSMALTNALLGLDQRAHLLGPLANCHWSELYRGPAARRRRRSALAAARAQPRRARERWCRCRCTRGRGALRRRRVTPAGQAPHGRIWSGFGSSSARLVTVVHWVSQT